MNNPYLEPVNHRALRVVGVVLMMVGLPLTLFLFKAVFVLLRDISNARALPHGLLVFIFILAAVCTFCWQAGARLAFNRPNRYGTLFSPFGWVVIGSALAWMTAIVAFGIVSESRQMPLAFETLVFVLALSIWCFVIAFRAWKQRSLDPR